MKQELRILHILNDLSNNTPLSLEALSHRYDTSLRTVQRDFKTLKEFLKDSLVSPQKGYYQLIGTSIFSNYLKSGKNADELREFFEFLAIFDTNALKFMDDEKFAFFKKLQKNSSKIYAIFENPIEELKNTKFLNDIKSAIINRQYCDILYNAKNPVKLKDIEPQKILYAQNNWYLAVMSKHDFQQNGGFQRLRINFIEDLKLKPTTFHSNQQAQRYIQDMQSLFQDYDAPDFEVIVRVDFEVSRYFRVKKFLKSQKLIEVEPNGDLILSYRINNPMEIIPLVKRWLPHLRVISPDSVDKRIREEIGAYLDRV
jgi:predicted DNA-binding transcriptional regulator YafY